MSEITIAEQFEEESKYDFMTDRDCVRRAIERLEQRLEALETWKADHFEDDLEIEPIVSARQFDFDSGFVKALDYAIKNYHTFTSDPIKENLEMLKQLREGKVPPVPKREWVTSIHHVWCLWKDNHVTHEPLTVMNSWYYGGEIVAIMPYHEGDTKPEPPEVK